MINEANFRLRFAPAPTGIMHIGNIRAALLNYLFSRQKNATFVLRIEDTDLERNFDPGGKQIISDLNWLGIEYDEGPVKGGPFGPYFQSQRNDVYEKSLKYIVENGAAYRCFCSIEELEKKRQRQIAMKIAPKYDKACLRLTQEEIDFELSKKTPFVWRFNIKPGNMVEFLDLAKGDMKFHTDNLTDFPLTRNDGSFTFLFANSVDDLTMGITHIFRGEDHLTNSASQVLIYKAFNAKIPTYLHLPIVCNLEGAKLSKRDFGFSILDLQAEGYLPEAICNYLATIGASFEQEIMSLEELTKEYNFEKLNSSGHVKYDPSKLKWFNHKWIQKMETKDLLRYAKPFIVKRFPNTEKFSDIEFENLINLTKTDIETLNQIPNEIEWVFSEPKINGADFYNIFENREQAEAFLKILKNNIEQISDDKFLDNLKIEIKSNNIPLKSGLSGLRMLLIGKEKGPNLGIILQNLGNSCKNRIINSLKNI